MSTENLLVDIGEDFVATITLNRPKELNTFNTHLARELVSALEELDQDVRARVIILKGEGKAFCAASTSRNFSIKPPWNTGPGSETWKNRW